MNHKINRIINGFIKLILSFIVICLFTICLSNYYISSYSRDKLYTDVDSIPEYEVGLLLGTTPQTRVGHKQNRFFKYRIEATESLFKSGKIKKILISGDNNSLDGINEVQSMKDSLVCLGIPEDCFILDGHGYRTLDAVVRASEVYGYNSYIVISQPFHNERAIYLAEHLTESHNIIGYNAKDVISSMAMLIYIREYLARVKVFVDVFTGKKPRILEKENNSFAFLL